MLVVSASSARSNNIVASSTFDSSLDGWYSDAPQQIQLQGSGGNSGGYLQFHDTTFNNPWVFAPQEFLGDWRPLENNGALEYDFKVIDLGNGAYDMVPTQFTISGPGGSASWQSSPTPPIATTDWVHWTIPIDSAHLHVTSGSLDSLLANVTELKIWVEGVSNNNGFDTDGLDNVVLSSVPEPSTFTLLALGAVALLGSKQLRRRSS